MEEHLSSIQNARSWQSKAFSYSRSVFAIVGLLAVLGLGAVFGLGSILRGVGVKTVFKAVPNTDSSAKAKTRGITIQSVPK